MADTYDLSTDIGKVRLLIGDRDPAASIFRDAEIQAFLDFNDSSLKRAAADAVETLASDQAYVLKAVTTLDITTNGPAVARALREHAATLRSQADASDAQEGSLFDIAELNTNAFQARQIITNKWLRREL